MMESSTSCDLNVVCSEQVLMSLHENVYDGTVVSVLMKVGCFVIYIHKRYSLALPDLPSLQSEC